MSTKVPPSAPSRVRRRILLAFLATVAAGAGLAYYFLAVEAAVNRRLAAAEAEADRLDPGWRPAELEAKRTALPDKENSALHILTVAGKLPPDWETNDKLLDLYDETRPECRLGASAVKVLREELAPVGAGLAEARKLKDMPRGRYPARKGGYTSASAGKALTLARLLQYAALLASEEGNADAAADDCLAVLHCSRSIGDEPAQLAQFFRNGLRAAAVAQIERTLAQGEPTSAALLRLQQALELDEPEPLLLFALRGERAEIGATMQAFETGKVNLAAMEVHLAMQLDGAKMSPGEPLPWVYLTARARSQCAALLEYQNRLVEAARLPLHQQRPRLKALKAEADGGPLLLRSFIRVVMTHAESDHRVLAQLRCAVVAVAAERHRKQRGAWPEPLEALKGTGYLKAVPLDPYDGNELRWVRLKDGAVVYSVGKDGVDNGGVLNRNNPSAEGAEPGVRLWDPAARRQPQGALPVMEMEPWWEKLKGGGDAQPLGRR